MKTNESNFENLQTHIYHETEEEQKSQNNQEKMKENRLMFN
jgi:hypothetical protein